MNYEKQTIIKKVGQSLGIFLRDGDPFNDEPEYVISEELMSLKKIRLK